MRDIEFMDRLAQVYQMYVEYRRDQDHTEELDIELLTLPASPYMDMEDLDDE